MNEYVCHFDVEEIAHLSDAHIAGLTAFDLDDPEEDLLEEVEELEFA